MLLIINSWIVVLINITFQLKFGHVTYVFDDNWILLHVYTKVGCTDTKFNNFYQYRVFANISLYVFLYVINSWFTSNLRQWCKMNPHTIIRKSTKYSLLFSVLIYSTFCVYLNKTVTVYVIKWSFFGSCIIFSNHLFL